MSSRERGKRYFQEKGESAISIATPIKKKKS